MCPKNQIVGLFYFILFLLECFILHVRSLKVNLDKLQLKKEK